MNNNLSCININWSSLGAKLANLSNTEQTAFFKTFAQEMNNYESTHQRDMQLASIVDGVDSQDLKITKEEGEIFSIIGEFSKGPA